MIISSVNYRTLHVKQTCSAGFRLGWSTKCGDKAMLVTADLSVLCNVSFFIYQLFCSNYFAMSGVFIFEAFIYNTV